MSLHYLPPSEAPDGKQLFGRSFIDFRYIVTVREDLFAALERPASLTPDALLDVYFGWMRHATGKEIPATLNCVACGHDIEVFAEVAEITAPDADY